MLPAPEIDTPWRDRFVRVVLTLVATALLLLVGWFALSAIRTSEHLAGVKSWKPLTGAVITQLLVLIMLPCLWLRLLVRTASPELAKTVESNRRALFLSYTRSWLARYLPGRIWTYGGRIWLANKIGIPNDAVARSMFLEIVFSYGILTVIGFSLLLSQTVSAILGTLVLATGLTVIAGSVRLLQWIIPEVNRRRTQSVSANLTGILFRVLVGGRQISFHACLMSMLLYGIHAVLNLVFISLLTFSFIEPATNQILMIAGAWAISMTLGWLALLAPGGLGARDGMALLLFSVTIDTPTAALIVAAARILGIATDVVFVATAEWIQFLTSNRKEAGSARIEGNKQTHVL